MREHREDGPVSERRLAARNADLLLAVLALVAAFLALALGASRGCSGVAASPQRAVHALWVVNVAALIAASVLAIVCRAHVVGKVVAAAAAAAAAVFMEAHLASVPAPCGES